MDFNVFFSHTLLVVVVNNRKQLKKIITLTGYFMLGTVRLVSFNTNVRKMYILYLFEL